MDVCCQQGKILEKIPPTGCKSNKNAKVTRFRLDGCMLLTRENTWQNPLDKMLSNEMYVTDDPNRACHYDGCVSATKRLAKQAHH